MSLQNHIFIDNTHLLKKVNGNLISFITLGKNYIHYSISNESKNDLYFVKTIYNESGTVGQAEFNSLLSDHLLRKSSLVHIAIDTAKQTLLPTCFLADNNREAYFNHIYEIEKEEEILVQQVNDEITELYVIKKATRSYLKSEFPSIKIYSHSACILKSYIQATEKLKEKNVVFIHTSHDSFYFTLFKNGKLHFYQAFDLISSSDVLYCLLNVLQLQQIEMNDVKVFITGFSHIQNEIADLLGNYFITGTLNENAFDKISVITAFPMHILFNQYSLISCAS